MKTVVFTGGGTLGPVTPLLAVAARLKERMPDAKFVWAGTDEGPERELIEKQGILFFTVPAAKLPRYLSLRLVTAPFDFLHARQVSARLVRQFTPSVVVSAGGFTATPVIQEAARLGIPCIAHQLDYQPGLSNRIVARLCKIVTTSFDYPLSPFGASILTRRIPTPVRFSANEVPSREAACSYFNFDTSRPVVFAMGGGTGSLSINESIEEVRRRLPQGTQILHLTGKSRGKGIVADPPGYVVREFFTDEMLVAYAAADVVVSRAGIGAISELATLSKPTILIPIPNSPQVQNVKALGDAVASVNQSNAGWEMDLADVIQDILDSENERLRLGQELHAKFPTDKGQALASIVLEAMK
jgi:UDP-N-acetylglucosamine--N-acetylmuramyl-(pentapeptide) pyrophosphoryl-undecaprenol N-acetylglucosamine transferase